MEAATTNLSHGSEIMQEIEFDFERLYNIYPRKEGKMNGMKKAARTITTIVDYRRFERAVKNYTEICKKDGRQKQFILLWQTFVNGRWHDYIQMSHEVAASKNELMLRRIRSGEL